MHTSKKSEQLSQFETSLGYKVKAYLMLPTVSRLECKVRKEPLWALDLLLGQFPPWFNYEGEG